MKIFENLNIFRNDNTVIGLSTFKENRNLQTVQTVYTGDYSISMFKMNLDKKINQQVGQNLYYLS